MSANCIFSYENAMKKQTIINWWLDNIFEPLITLKLLDYGNDVRKWMQKLNGITSLCCSLSDPVSENGNGHNAFHHIDFILNCVIINLQVWLTPCWRDARVRHENTSCHNITWSKKQQEQHRFAYEPNSLCVESLSLTYKHEILRQSHVVSSRSENNPPPLMLELK